MKRETAQLLIKRAVKHRKADEIVQGKYWQDGKGCCVGCLAEVDDGAHKHLAQMTDLPEWIFHAADAIHEELPSGEYQKWPERLARALAKVRKWDDVRATKAYRVMICTEVLLHEKLWEGESYGDAVSKSIRAVRDAQTAEELEAAAEAAWAARAAALYVAGAVGTAARAALDAAREAAGVRMRNGLLRIIRECGGG